MLETVRREREKSEKALVATAVQEERDEWDLALVTSAEHALFSKHEVLLDNEASISVFQNKELLTGVRRAEKNVQLGGIQRGAAGVRVTEEGIYRDVGIVYYSDLASAKILSFASEIDAGADITYDKANDRFVMTPVSGEYAYYFGRKEVTGSEGRFYVCDTRTMIESREGIHVATVEENLSCFTKREIEQARKARELLVRMGFPSVQQAIRTVNSGSNFDVTARDFELADAI
jgi:hypothetical protein